jgi:hypothetical protein
VLAILDSSISAWPITAWLWLTVIFADLAEALGTAQVAILRGSSQDARKLAGSSPDRRTATCGGAASPRPRRPDLRCHHQSRARRVGRDAWLAHRCGRRCLRDADVSVQVPALAGSRALRQLDVPIGLDPLLSHRFPVVDMVVAS